MRRKSYAKLLAIFPVFFLLHWNGLFSFTYYWALEAVGGTDRFGPQITAAFLSAVAIFSVIIAFGELLLFLRRRGVLGKSSGQ